MGLIATATISSGGKMHVPAEVLAKLNVKPGEEIAFLEGPGPWLVVVPAANLTAPRGHSP